MGFYCALPRFLEDGQRLQTIPAISDWKGYFDYFWDPLLMCGA